MCHELFSKQTVFVSSYFLKITSIPLEQPLFHFIHPPFDGICLLFLLPFFLTFTQTNFTQSSLKSNSVNEILIVFGTKPTILPNFL